MRSAAETQASGQDVGSFDSSPLPTPALPRGGGACHGIGERLSVDSSSGSCSVTVPLAVSPGRAASSVELALTYSSGASRSPFGLGWDIAVPKLCRNTAQGVPTYTDEDTFVLAGHADLVPLLVPDGLGDLEEYDQSRPIDGVTHRVRRYRPRVGDGSQRIERCRDPVSGNEFWRTVSRDNVTMTFGRTPDSRVADPRDLSGVRRVSEWLLDEVRDDRGNLVHYEYKREDTVGVAASIHESRRLEPGAPAQAGNYLKRIHYANAVAGDASTTRMMVVLDYGEHDLADAEVQPWTARPDPYSTYRSGFEVRTWRLCRRVLVFHDFPELAPSPLPRLVKATELTHDADRVATTLAAVRHVGYSWVAGAYVSAALPPVEFSYTPVVRDDRARPIAMRAVADGAAVRWLDLDGDGLPGVLSVDAGCWWYQRPAGDGRMDPPVPVADLPLTARRDGPPQLTDVDGSGRLSAVGVEPGISGTATRRPDGTWSHWRPYDRITRADLAAQGVQSIDLDGDGLADLMRKGPDEICWSRGLGREGYADQRRVAQPVDERDGPRPPSADTTRAWLCADMSGDGLTDLVRVLNGRVDYWPNLGHGRFGPRTTMAAAPTLDQRDLFDASRVRLADLDGTGCCDLVYIGRRELVTWSNRAGNGFAPGQVVTPFPVVRSTDDVQVLDLLGKGTACLVWTTAAPSDTGVVGRYLDLCRGTARPRQLRAMTNNLGVGTEVDYASSAVLALADRRAGNAWSSRLSFPVQVAVRTVATDDVTGSAHTTTYGYRDGYFDPPERELRGFGAVRSRDGEVMPAPAPGAPVLHTPPTRTDSWLHHGGPLPGPTAVFALDPAASPPDHHEIVGVAGGPAYRQAVAALARRPLRTEVYGEDGLSAAPYTVTTQRHRVVELQPPRAGYPAAFRVEPLATVAQHYERTIDDPRVVHDLTLVTDEYGNAVSTARVAYARRVPAIAEQTRPLVSWALTEVANTDDDATHRLGVLVASRDYEVTGLAVPAGGLYDLAGLRSTLPGLAEIAIEHLPSPGIAQRRLVEATRHEYWADDLSAGLPFGQVGRRALPRRTLRLALTPGLVSEVFGAEVDTALLSGEAGYELADGAWWAGDGVVHPDPAACYQPTRWDSGFGNTATVSYDPHHLFVAKTTASTTAPLDRNAVSIVHDYRTLAPRAITDAQGTVVSVEFDALGRVERRWRVAADGSGDTPSLPGIVHSYGSDAWHAGVGPAWSQTDTREAHGSATARLQRQRMYTDGLGRIVMTKTATNAGPALTTDGAGALTVVDTTPAERWIGSGRTVFTNKSLPAVQYEPYFSTTIEFETADAVLEHAVSEIRTYDPLGRITRIDRPDGTLEIKELGAWQERAWDANDTVLQSQWYAARQGAGVPAPEARAASLAAAHAGTPLVSLTDALGRVVRTRVDDGLGGVFETVMHLDLAGQMTAVDDAAGRRSVTQRRDAAGRILTTTSIDAGVQRALPRADGLQIRHWNATGHRARSVYDKLSRPMELWVRKPASATERLAELTLYGEAHPDATGRCLVGRVHRRYDDAGLSRVDRHDFAGNLTEGVRLLAVALTDPDWIALHGQPLAALDALAAAHIEPESFALSSTYDAVGRPTTQRMPDGGSVSLSYGAAGHVERDTGSPRGPASGHRVHHPHGVRRPRAARSRRLRQRRDDHHRLRRGFRPAQGARLAQGRKHAAGPALHLRPRGQRRAGR